MTRAPLVRDAAAFSAASRQMLARRNSVSPSFHSLEPASYVRGVEAMVKFATAAPAVATAVGSFYRLLPK